MGNPITKLKIYLSIGVVFLFYVHRLDDLLIGAPLYTIKKDGRIIPDAGRVDIFLQTSEVYSLKNMIYIDFDII